MSIEEFKNFLENECKYKDVRFINEYQYASIYPLLFTHAIIIGTVGRKDSFDDRWCYHEYKSALSALNDWAALGYKGEPQGWHRHPNTGRRRENGDPTKEEVRL